MAIISEDAIGEMTADEMIQSIKELWTNLTEEQVYATAFEIFTDEQKDELAEAWGKD